MVTIILLRLRVEPVEAHRIDLAVHHTAARRAYLEGK
jgi:hypothetical protein